MFWKKEASAQVEKRDFYPSDPQKEKVNAWVNASAPLAPSSDDRKAGSAERKAHAPNLNSTMSPPLPNEKRTPGKPLAVSGAVHVPNTLPRDAGSRDTALEGAAAFGKITSVLMRDAELGAMPLSDLSWRVAPAIEAGTYAVVDATNLEKRTTTPAAAALWAFVSPEVDRRLTAQIANPVQLAAHEWTSGSIPWIVAASGEPVALQKLFQHLLETRFQGMTIKMRTIGADGRATVSSFEGAP